MDSDYPFGIFKLFLQQIPYPRLVRDWLKSTCSHLKNTIKFINFKTVSKPIYKALHDSLNI